MAESLLEICQHLHQDALVHNHRRLIVVSGSREWCETQALTVWQSDFNHDWGKTWVGEPLKPGISAYAMNQAQRCLGQSLSLVVFDTWSGFNPNSLGQVSGTLVGGGVMLLLCPDLDQWLAYDDPEYQNLVAYPQPASAAHRRFLTRALMYLEDDAYTVIYREGHSPSGMEVELPDAKTADQSPITDSEDDQVVLPNKTLDQQRAVALILQQFRRGRRPVVLTADRGRGKTAALGIAAAQLSGLDFKRIIITAPDRGNVDSLFTIARQLLLDYEHSKNALTKSDRVICYMEPEQALENASEGSVLLVDEAAAIPVPMLNRLLMAYTRIAFATTVHGYEGTGRGFALRFRHILSAHTPNWKETALQQPIRWHSGDPLEQLVFQLLLLDAEAVADKQLAAPAVSSAAVEYQRLDRDQLTENYQLLSQLFGLLVLAHYRTTPGDLRMLLDSPELSVWVATQSGLVVGALLVVEEGPLPEAIVDDIWLGKRRPRGHQLHQTLIAQEGMKAVAPLLAGRVMRIAVHPAMQRRKVGSGLLQVLHQHAESSGWDFIGSSFAATPDLLSYWCSNNFTPVRVGLVRDHVSGSYATSVMQGISSQGHALVNQLKQRFTEQLRYRVSGELKSASADLICPLLKHSDEQVELSAADRAEIEAFLVHNRGYENAALAINKYLRVFLRQCSDTEIMALVQQEAFQLLVAKNLQQRSWDALETNGLGRKALVKQLKQALQAIIA